ncbi:MAG: aconitate hydratase AcnA [Candidatus Latescibacteria bacterium]|jgi:aconitate hydratase|nr:aconitate hydratase AcnA [Candidatus Latescibacterota bacterium]MBT5831256.1 aconitate hydratase AcnA [Candidatus Latescibacterota bacterium]
MGVSIMSDHNPLNSRDTLQTSGGDVAIYRLDKLEADGVGPVSGLPYSVKVLLEAALRNLDHYQVQEEDVKGLANWNATNPNAVEIPFKPARVVLQDFTGVPSLVDLAALRSAMGRMGGNAQKIEPLIPVDLVVDHSVQVDSFANVDAVRKNAEIEFERNNERYEFLRWGSNAFESFRVVPPLTGIVHQVNLEYLAKGVISRNGEAFPDSLVGTDSHTTMINGLGVLGWGVGGIEAEAVMLGQPIYMLTPEVVGFKLTGQLPEGTTATDLTLMVVQMLREKGVVGKFVEFYGSGLSGMTLADRATIANMAPEYGATMGFFPVDDETLRFLASTGRTKDEVDLVERYTKEQGMFRTDASPVPKFTDTLELDLSAVVPSLAGPKRPQDRVALTQMKSAFETALTAPVGNSGFGLDNEATKRKATVAMKGQAEVGHGAVVIAAITSCTNTSNPSVMIAAGLLAKKAAAKGLTVPSYVKTSLAPGSRVVTDYLDQAGLTSELEKLGFHTVGYGCTTCIGNSGPLPEPVVDAIRGGDLVAASVLSGNRNFEGRVHQHVKANYLASPPLVVAYALAGRVDVDLVNDPLGNDTDDNPVYLKDIWPSQKEIADTIALSLKPEMFENRYGNVFDGNDMWNAIAGSQGELYEWQLDSTYVQEPPFFVDLSAEPSAVTDIEGARVLALLGDSVTTDHISPAGSIAVDSPAGQYLISKGVEPKDFNSYGSRRGNHEVMMRGTFANIRIRNLLAPGTEGGVTVHIPSDEQMSIYDAGMKYIDEGVPSIVIAGKEYGTGSSRDWAAKGPALQGVKAVIVESFERIHRSNLVGMGVLPLQFKDGESAVSLGLTGKETYAITGISGDLSPLQDATVTVTDDDGNTKSFATTVRIDTPVEIDYYRNGGILHTVLRDFLKDA